MNGKTKVLILLVIAVVLVGGIYLSPNSAEQSKGFPSMKASAPANPQIAVTKDGVTGPQKSGNKPTASVGAYALSTSAKKPDKVAGFKPHQSMQAHKYGKQGGDNCGSATVIPGLPYADNGTTVGYTNDYDEVCPYSGSTSPDVVYSFAPATNKVVNIDLWGSSYDTKLYVYQGTCDNAHLVACNDD